MVGPTGVEPVSSCLKGKSPSPLDEDPIGQGRRTRTPTVRSQSGNAAITLYPDWWTNRDSNPVPRIASALCYPCHYKPIGALRWTRTINLPLIRRVR